MKRVIGPVLSAQDTKMKRWLFRDLTRPHFKFRGEFPEPNIAQSHGPEDVIGVPLFSHFKFRKSAGLLAHTQPPFPYHPHPPGPDISFFFSNKSPHGAHRSQHGLDGRLFNFYREYESIE